uniref:Uncharacterized protein n=1 Tax=Heterorhabditis bacteriophora TaxID=37862 RepID=A0A1I7WCM1_HETBA
MEVIAIFYTAIQNASTHVSFFRMTSFRRSRSIHTNESSELNEAAIQTPRKTTLRNNEKRPTFSRFHQDEISLFNKFILSTYSEFKGDGIAVVKSRFEFDNSETYSPQTN